jgi:hypothetical protein
MSFRAEKIMGIPKICVQPKTQKNTCISTKTADKTPNQNEKRFIAKQ